MEVEDPEIAVETLRRVNYYRLSGYWYPFRKQTSSRSEDAFYAGTRFSDVVALYESDTRLRAVTCIRSGWSATENELRHSCEDFFYHHHQKYGGRLPVWAATELMDRGSLSYLYGFSPREVQDAIAGTCGLRTPQLSSWLKALNLVRNSCAHHGRLFNRVHTISPMLPRVGLHPDLDIARTEWNRTFARLTLVQFLSDRLGLGRGRMLSALVKTFPSLTIVPISPMGVPVDWQENPLWAAC